MFSSCGLSPYVTPSLWPAPWALGAHPVHRVAMEGRVQGAWDWARVKRVPVAARLSSTGEVSRP